MIEPIIWVEERHHEFRKRIIDILKELEFPGNSLTLIVYKQANHFNHSSFHSRLIEIYIYTATAAIRLIYPRTLQELQRFLFSPVSFL